MFVKLALPAALLTVAASTAVMPAPKAEAASAKCAAIQSASVGGYNWTPLRNVKRSCSNSLSYGVSGTSYLAQKRIVVNYSERRSTVREAGMATVHELAHNVEYRTTPAQRAKLYSYLGMPNTKGDYFSINDAYYYNGSLARWKQSPRERLAESVVNCTYGAPNHAGLKLVSKAQCKPFLATFRASLGAVR